VDKETKVSKDTRIALPADQYEAGLLNALDQETYKAMFRAKGSRNVGYLKSEAQHEYHTHKKELNDLGDHKGSNGVTYWFDVVCKKR
jgi:hypothetical protein